MRRLELLGICYLLISSFLFAACGPLAQGLYGSGWTPGAVLLFRVLGGAALLAAPFLPGLRHHWVAIRRGWVPVLVYGAVSVAGMQACFFLSVQYLSTAISLLIQMLAPVLIVCWVWVRTGQRPATVTFLGIMVALGGLLLLLGPQGEALNPIGVVYAFGGALCLAVFFISSANPPPGVPSMLFSGAGMAVGSVFIALLCLLRVLPAEFSSSPTAFAGFSMPWFAPVALIVLGTAAAYVLGIVGLRFVSATVGSFTSFAQVPFAALIAWLMLAEMPAPVLFVGSALILCGIALVKRGEILTTRRVSANASITHAQHTGRSPTHALRPRPRTPHTDITP